MALFFGVVVVVLAFFVGLAAAFFFGPVLALAFTSGASSESESDGTGATSATVRFRFPTVLAFIVSPVAAVSVAATPALVCDLDDLVEAVGDGAGAFVFFFGGIAVEKR